MAVATHLNVAGPGNRTEGSATSDGYYAELLHARRFTICSNGHIACMFVWTKRSGRPGRMRFMWWPLLISIALSIVLTIVLNALI